MTTIRHLRRVTTALIVLVGGLLLPAPATAAPGAARRAVRQASLIGQEAQIMSIWRSNTR